MLAIPEGEHVIAGLAPGYADPDALVNAVVSAREALDVFATFHDEEG